MLIRDYDPERDFDAVVRVHKEVGWLPEGKAEAFRRCIGCGRALVAEVNGEAECLVTTATGTIRYLDEELPFATATGVAVGRTARKRGVGSRTTARAIAADAAAGAIVHGVWIFDQGFYSRLGYGNGAYEHIVDFDPHQLTVDARPRVPRRFTAADFETLHAARLARRRGHGAVAAHSPVITRTEMEWDDNGFGLGYCDGPNGEVTHHLWCLPGRPEHGPYDVRWMTWHTPEQFRELLALLRGLGDQVRLVHMREPQGIQLQDFLDRPFRHRAVTEKGRFQVGIRAWAYWQMRVCDLGACLARTHLWAGPVRFNLELTDPIETYLDGDAPWHGVAGDYVVTLGPSSEAVRGSDGSLPTLRASVGALTRMWLGVRPASGLAVTDELAGPPELLAALDRVLCLPDPKPDWDF